MELQQIIGLVALIVFIAGAGLIGGLSASKRKKATDEILAKLKEKKIDGDDTWFITSDRIVVYFPGTSGDYTISEFKLDEIAYVMLYRERGGGHYASFYDSNKKLLKGDRHLGDKTKTVKTHFVLAKNNTDIWSIISKHNSNAKLVGPYFKEPTV